MTLSLIPLVQAASGTGPIEFPSSAWCRSHPYHVGKGSEKAIDFVRGASSLSNAVYKIPCKETVHEALEIRNENTPNDSKMPEGSTLINFLLDPNTVGAVTWVGTIVTLSGLWMTYLQAEKSATAAEAARNAVGRAEHRVAAVSVAHANAQMTSVAELIAIDDLPKACIVFGLTKRMLVEACHLAEKRNPEDIFAKQIRNNIRTVEFQFDTEERDEASDEHAKKKSILKKAVAGIGESLMNLEMEYTYPRDPEN